MPRKLDPTPKREPTEPYNYFNALEPLDPDDAQQEELRYRFWIEWLHNRTVDVKLFRVEMNKKRYILEVSMLPHGSPGELISAKASLRHEGNNESVLDVDVYVSDTRWPEDGGKLSGQDSISLDKKGSKGLPKDAPAALLEKMLFFFQRAADQLKEPVVHSSYYLETFYEEDSGRNLTPAERDATINPVLTRHGYVCKDPTNPDPEKQKWEKTYQPNRILTAS